MSNRVLFVESQFVKDNSILDNNISDEYITQGIWRSQENIIYDTLGTSLYNRLTQGIIDDDLSDEEKTLINDHIQICIIYQVVNYVITDGTYKVTSNGIITIAGNNDYNTVDKGIINGIMNDNQRLLRKYIQRLYYFLTYNSNDYPDFNDYTNGFGYAPRVSVSTQDIHISKYRGNNKKTFF